MIARTILLTVCLEGLGEKLQRAGNFLIKLGNGIRSLVTSLRSIFGLFTSGLQLESG